ncbi:hypothetical protein JL49_08050 [Pseudoalteromonas luteoviolacea]|nr:hypothetical protein JL49_08050 [Pseudoalteromonas luteoviolacea]
MSFEVAELMRRFANMLMLGTIEEVDHDTQKVRVKVGELVTGWLPWPAELGRNFIRWRPLKPGIQCLIACPAGEPTQAVIIQLLYTTEFHSPSISEHMDVLTFNDGTHIQYDSENSVFDVNCAKDVTINIAGNVTAHVVGDVVATVDGSTSITSAGDFNIEAGGNFNVKASQTNIESPVTQTGGDMTSDGISAQKHLHAGITAGPGKTGAPE